MNSCSLGVFLIVCVICSGVTNTTSIDWHFRGQNIALHKETFQRPGTLKDDGSPTLGYPASLAVDGNENSDFSAGSCSHTIGSYYLNQSQHVAQWVINLNGSFDVTGIIIVNRKDERFRLKNFLVFGFNNKLCTTAKDYWCQIYSDYLKYAYQEDVIKIKVDPPQAYSAIAINVPKHFYAVDKGLTYLTLCEVKIYAVACPTLMVRNGYMNPDQTLFGVNAKATIFCDNGFDPSNQEITCLNTGAWSYYSQCNIIHCAYPGILENWRYIIGNTSNGKVYSPFSSLPFGTDITGKCDIGYESKSNEVIRRCQSNKTWSGNSLVCTKTQCPYPGKISNGVYYFQNGTLYNSESSFYNTTIYLTCDKGYYVIGSKELTCAVSKTWKGGSNCVKVKCDFPETHKHVTYERKDRRGNFIPYTNGPSSYSDVIHVICSEGYVLNSTSDVRKCLETKTWSGESSQCVLVSCEKLEELKGGFYNYTNPATLKGFPYNTVVTAECNETFRLSDPQRNSRRCTEKGVWDNAPVSCISVLSEAGTELGSKTALIAGVSATVVILISSTVAVFFLYRRRQRHNGKGEEHKPKRYANLKKNEDRMANQHEGVYVEIQEANITAATEASPGTTRRSNSQSVNDTMYSLPADVETIKPSFPSSVSLKSQHAYYSFTNVKKMPKTAIPVKELSDLVLTGHNAKEKFETEFQSLPQGMVQAHKEALKKQNIGKNRYRNLYAYDETRVTLDTDDTSQADYINACYVHGFKKSKQYIASQGPTTEILTDFWRMIWQTESSKIVMLTNLVEEGKKKCEQYWPEEGHSITYGRITVLTKTTENFSQFVIRTLTLRKDSSKDRPRIVTQFHFKAWPDKGVPKYASALVQFLNKVNQAPVHGKGPLVVHCSAGVGRTGTLIALDYLTEQGETMGYVDVVGTVTVLRNQRVCLVQTLEQFIFVHHALVESLMLPTSALPAAKFPEAYQELLQMDNVKKKRKLCVEFETLKKVSPVTDECEYVSSKLILNRKKNRYSNILPVDEFMPSLTSDSYKGDTRYINAVFLPSYKEPKAFIITQTPLESTREDFWDLVWEHDVHTIVMLNNISETSDSERYWPHKDDKSVFANIEITNSGAEDIGEHQVVSLTVKKYKLTRKVKQIRCGKWPSKHSSPDSPEVLLTLMELVQALQQQTGNHSILVHCMNGADKSGLFCVISAVIERTKIEQDVAISQVIEEMRNAREQIIPSVEQYQFCHETVLAFIHQYDTYSNFTA